MCSAAAQCTACWTADNESPTTVLGLGQGGGRALRPTRCVKKESQPWLWNTYICLLAASRTATGLVYTRTSRRT